MVFNSKPEIKKLLSGTGLPRMCEAASHASHASHSASHASHSASQDASHDFNARKCFQNMLLSNINKIK